MSDYKVGDTVRATREIVLLDGSVVTAGTEGTVDMVQTFTARENSMTLLWVNWEDSQKSIVATREVELA